MRSMLSRVSQCTALLSAGVLKINREIRRQSDLSFTALFLLDMLWMTKEPNAGIQARMQDVAKMNGVSKSTVTDYIDGLEKKGYVQRVKDECDQRVLYLKLTNKGEKILLHKEEKTLEYLEKCASNLTGEELETFSALFSKFMGGVGTEPFPKLFKDIWTQK